MAADPARQFGDLEAVIMDYLWTHGTAKVRDVYTVLHGERKIAYTTVMTVMDNLHRKDWLSRHRDGKAYVYQPTSSREGYVAALMHEALTRTNDRDSAFAHFVNHIDPADAQALRRALATHD